MRGRAGASYALSYSDCATRPTDSRRPARQS